MTITDTPLPVTLAVIDMAGTTLSDNGSVERAVEDALASVGIDTVDPDQLKALRGMSKSEMFTHLTPDAAQAAAAHVTFTERMLTAVHEDILTPKDGATALFSSLRARNVTVCLMTGFDRIVQEALLERFGWADLVDLTVAQSSELRGRPFPDLILRAAIQTRTDNVRQILVAGDTTNDLFAGTRAGAGHVIGVLGGAHDRELLETAPHTALAAHLTNIIDVLG